MSCWREIKNVLVLRKTKLNPVNNQKLQLVKMICNGCLEDAYTLDNICENTYLYGFRSHIFKVIFSTSGDLSGVPYNMN